MSGINHVAGGVVFTGIYLSMADVNIFSSAAFLFFTAFFSLLPDIDHTSSIIGKPFYPISRYLDLKFGHRTITHSLICYAVLIVVVKMFELIITGGNVITHIFIWAYASHLILDMLTIKGIPLLYPFKKNPCVIPGNPKYRFHASDFKTEAMMFGFFLLLAFSLQDLFANGFWNTYNRKWNSLKALYTEMKIYDKVINVIYDYEEKGITYAGTGTLINADLEKALLFDYGFVEIRSDYKINILTPVRTQNKISFQEIYFSEITLDSLMTIIKDKPITALSIRSNLPIEFAKDNRPQSGLSVDLQNVFNPILKGNSVDSVDINIQKDMLVAEEELNILKSRITEQWQVEDLFQKQKREAQQSYNSIHQSIQSLDLATKEKAIKDVQSAKSHLAQFQNHTYNPTSTLKIALEKLNFLKSKQHIYKQQTVSGFMEFFTIN